MRIGELLISKRLITEEELNQALELQKDRGEKLGRILIDLGFIAYREVLLALSEQLQVPLVLIDSAPPAIPEAEGLSPRFLRQSRCLPIGLTEAGLQLAMADPLDFETIAAVRSFTGLRVVPALAGEQEIVDAIDRYFGEQARPEETTLDGQAGEDLEHLRDMASEAPVIRMVNTVIA